MRAVELLAGAASIGLLGLNMRDGLKMKGRFRPGSLNTFRDLDWDL